MRGRTLMLLAFAAATLAAAPARAEGPPGPVDQPYAGWLRYLPEEIEYDGVSPIPPGYHAEKRVRRGAVATGASLFGSFYALSALAFSVTEGRYGTGALIVPVVGPFITASNVEVNNGFTRATLVVDGLVQTLGVGLFIYGLSSPQHLLVRDEPAAGRLLVAPTLMGGKGFGLGLATTM